MVMRPRTAEGHISHHADRLASTRVRRAATALSPARLRRNVLIKSGDRLDAKLFRPISRMTSAFIGEEAFYRPEGSQENAVRRL